MFAFAQVLLLAAVATHWGAHGKRFGPQVARRNADGNGTAADHSDFRIKVMGQSGKFKFYDTSSDAKAVTVAMDALAEVAADGVTAVGASGKIKHSINTFAAQAFTTVANTAASVGGVRASQLTFKTSIKGMANTSLVIDTFLFTDSGIVGTPTERWPVSKGDLKFNLLLNDWEWCGCAKGQGEEVGAFVDIMIAVSGGGDAADTDATATTEAGGDKAKTDKVDTAGGKPDTSDPAEDKERPGGGKKATATEQSPTGAAAQAEPTAAPKNPNKGGNGGGKRLARDLQYGPVRREANNATTVSNTSSAVATAAPTPATPAIISKKQIKLGGLNIHLSDQIQIDGKWTAMAAGYPKVEAKGAKMIFTFRFPKFKHEAKYDPLISSSAEPVVVATAAETFKKELARAQTQLAEAQQAYDAKCATEGAAATKECDTLKADIAAATAALGETQAEIANNGGVDGGVDGGATPGNAATTNPAADPGATTAPSGASTSRPWATQHVAAWAAAAAWTLL